MVASVSTDAIELTDLDIERLNAKYLEERDKRVRADGRKQFTEMRDFNVPLMRDPFSEPIERTPLFDEVDAVIIGGGFSGLLAGANMRKLGYDRIRIIDRAGGVGGTWYWNRYPGLRCDIESYIYLPMLEETGYIPSEKYVLQSEILEHAERIATRFDLYRDACFQTEVTRLEWDEAASQWIVETTRGDRMRARYVFNAPGSLQRPHLPDIEGIGDFKGRMFLSSRWDFDYTKGDVNGGLEGLRDKRVALIGTGATAIQCMPIIAEYARELYVVQRTPCSIARRSNPKTDPEWVHGLQPGWRRKRMFNFAAIVSGMPQEEDLVNDGFSAYFGEIIRSMPEGVDAETAGKIADLVDFKTQEARRNYASEVVGDPAVAEALKPYYRLFCKRPTFSNDYYHAFNRPNVTLVDTQGRGLDRITEHSIVNGDREYEVDCIIMSSGFEADSDHHARSGFELIGRDGVSLFDKWQSGVRTFQSIYTSKFPNLFNIACAQGGFYLNHMNRIEQDIDHIMFTLRHMRAIGKTVVETTPEAEEYWLSESRKNKADDTAFLEGCTPGQYNNEGKPDGTGILSMGYGGGIVAWENALREWREGGTFEGLTFR